MSEVPLNARLREFLRNLLVPLLALSFLCGLPGVGEGIRVSLDTVGHHCACPVGLDGCSCAVGETAPCHQVNALVVADGQPVISHRCLEQDALVLTMTHLPPPPSHEVTLPLPSAIEIAPPPGPLALVSRPRDPPTPPPLVS